MILSEATASGQSKENDLFYKSLVPVGFGCLDNGAIKRMK